MDEHVLDRSMWELFEHAPCGYVLMLPNGKITRINQTVVDWIGRSREHLLEGRFQDLLTIAGKIFYENQFAPLLRLQGSAHGVAFDLAREGREPLPVLVSSVQNLDDQGAPALIASVLIDATDRRAYERELLHRRLQVEQLAAIVTASSDAIVTTTAHGSILTWNAGAARLFGRTTPDVVGRDVSEILPSLDVRSTFANPGGQLITASAVHLETVASRADQSQIDVSVDATAHLGPLGDVATISFVVRDMSEQRAIERLQQEFLAMTSHELRNPLAVIKARAQLMRRRGYSESAVDAILSSAEDLDRLINDLMLASQIQAERLTLYTTVSDLVAEARAAAEEFADRGFAIRFETAAVEGSVRVEVDRARMHQVFANLLTNAVKYSGECPDVIVRVGHDDHEARVEVIDHGIGIAPEIQPYVFDRFFRAEPTASRIQGVGLGLFITRRIVEAHGGSISVASEPGQGSTFTVRLPCATERLGAAPEPATRL